LIRCEEIHAKEKLDGVDNSTMRKELIEANDWLVILHAMHNKIL